MNAGDLGLYVSCRSGLALPSESLADASTRSMSPPSSPASRGRFFLRVVGWRRRLPRSPNGPRIPADHRGTANRASGVQRVDRVARHGARVNPGAGGKAMNLGDLILFVLLAAGYGYLFFWGL